MCWKHTRSKSLPARWISLPRIIAPRFDRPGSMPLRHVSIRRPESPSVETPAGSDEGACHCRVLSATEIGPANFGPCSVLPRPRVVPPAPFVPVPRPPAIHRLLTVSSRRLLKAAEAIREVVASSILTEMRDPRVQDVTVLGVEVSPDMREAKVSISVMGSEAQEQLAIRGLQNAAGFLQSRIANRIETRYTPRLQFKLDKGAKNAMVVGENPDENTKRKKRKRRPGSARPKSRFTAGTKLTETAWAWPKIPPVELPRNL